MIAFATVPPFSVKVFVVPSFDTTKVKFSYGFFNFFSECLKKCQRLNYRNIPYLPILNLMESEYLDLDPVPQLNCRKLGNKILSTIVNYCLLDWILFSVYFGRCLGVFKHC
jgi:hypothetical protein